MNSDCYIVPAHKVCTVISQETSPIRFERNKFVEKEQGERWLQQRPETIILV